MVVWGFGAAGSAGKLSWLLAGRDRLPPAEALDWPTCAADPVFHEGRDAADDEAAEAVVVGAGREGSEGKALEEETWGLEEELLDDATGTHPGGPRVAVVTGAGPRRVLFLSFNTLLECFWAGVP